MLCVPSVETAGLEPATSCLPKQVNQPGALDRDDTRLIPPRVPRDNHARLPSRLVRNNGDLCEILAKPFDEVLDRGAGVVLEAL